MEPGDPRGERNESHASAGAKLASEAAAEIENLKKLLAEAEHANLRAVRSASEYRDQLTEAQAEIAGIKARWNAAEKARSDVRSEREMDTMALTTQLHRSLKELEREQSAHKADADQAAAKLLALEQKLAEAETSATGAQASRSRDRKVWALCAAGAAVLAVIIGGIVLYRQHHASKTVAKPPSPVETVSRPPSTPRRPSVAATPAATIRAAAIPAALSRPSHQATPMKRFVPTGVTTDLTQALARMNRALSSFPDEDPQAVLHEVYVRQSTASLPVCAFEWTNGEAALIFRDAHAAGNLSAWAVTISRCADAVEQAR